MISDSDLSDEELSNEPEDIRIGKVLWKIGDCVYSTGDDAVEKAKMVETFGDAWKTARAEGIILGKRRKLMIRIQWTNLSGKPVSVNIICLKMHRQFRRKIPQKASFESNIFRY